MKKRQRKVLSDLCSICNQIGGILDSTSTNPKKFQDRQRVHGLVYTVIYGVLCDEPENDFREEDFKSAIDALEKIKEISARQYGDRDGL